MSMLKSSDFYRDVIPYLNAALDNVGAMIECETVGGAISMVQRLNKYRVNLRRQGNTDLDQLEFCRKDNVVVIRQRMLLQIKSIKTLDGADITDEVKEKTGWDPRSEKPGQSLLKGKVEL